MKGAVTPYRFTVDEYYRMAQAGIFREDDRVQRPVRLSLYAEPEPDIALVRPRADKYRSGHPGPEEVLLIIEVADTSLDYDRDRKLPLYAAAGIPGVWIADLNGEQISALREPANGGYQRATVYRRGDSLTAGALPALTLTVDEVLG